MSPYVPAPLIFIIFDKYVDKDKYRISFLRKMLQYEIFNKITVKKYLTNNWYVLL